MDSIISLRMMREERPRTPPPSRLRRLMVRSDIAIIIGTLFVEVYKGEMIYDRIKKYENEGCGSYHTPENPRLIFKQAAGQHSL